MIRASYAQALSLGVTAAQLEGHLRAVEERIVAASLIESTSLGILLPKGVAWAATDLLRQSGFRIVKDVEEGGMQHVFIEWSGG